MNNISKLLIIPATLSDYPAIQKLWPFYIYDLGRECRDVKSWEWPTDPDFVSDDLTPYFKDAEKKAFLIKVNDELAGFVFINQLDVMPEIDFYLNDFFILAKFQNQGLGNRVAIEMFDQLKGRWAVGVIPKNIKALKFWRKIISKATDGNYREVFKTADELRNPENPDPYAMNLFTFDLNNRLKQKDRGEVWMLKDLCSKNDPLATIQKLIKERYEDAKAIFWAGSVSVNQGTSASDLDLVIVFESLPNAYREAFFYDGWPIDVFIHDLDTLQYFFEESRTGNGISGLCYMILNGREVTNPSAFSENVKTLAQEVLNAGPATWEQEQIDKERFLITDVLDDIKNPAGRDEQIASAAWLLEALGQFYFRSQNKWCASGKSIIRYLKSDNPDLALEFTQAFEGVFQTGYSAALELLVKKILKPYGGLFWNGFRSDAPKESRITEAGILPKLIEELERSLLDPSVRQSTEQLNKLIADDFLEFGSSGKVYNKQDCIKPDDTPRKFVVSDFKIKELSKDVTLATYKTTEDGIASLRSSIWKRCGDEWKILFHQGTKFEVKDERKK